MLSNPFQLGDDRGALVLHRGGSAADAAVIGRRQDAPGRRAR